MGYELINHTADLGIRVRSSGLAALFADAAGALVDLLGADSREETAVEEIEVEGLDTADLLVRWLQEILFLADTRGFRVSSMKIMEMEGTRLRAELAGSYGGSTLSHEIKAVTYHGLDIRHIDNCLEATIIFDM
jgi:SHS2 domain-containing protein